MKISCQREPFVAAFMQVAAIAPSRSTKEILQKVKLEADQHGVTLLATDLEVGIRHRVEGVEVEVPGSVVLPPGRFGQILRESTDESFRIDSDGQSILFRGSRSRFSLPAQSPHEFPPVPGFDETSCYQLPSHVLYTLIHRTLFATDNESSRYALGGVKFEVADGDMVAVSTDGRRLAKMQSPVSVQGEPVVIGDATIVPSRALQFVERLIGNQEGDVQIALRQNEMLFRMPHATLFTRLLEGRFPTWRSVIPNRPASAKIDVPVSPFASAVRQAAIFTNENSKGVSFKFGEGTATLAGHAAEIGEAHVEMPTTYDGPAVSVSLDPKYMLDFLKVLDSQQTFTIDIESNEAPAVCSTNDQYRYVIMPLAR